MYRLTIKHLLSFICLSLFISGQAFSQLAKHVIIISIDGFRPEFYQDNSWAAPNLRQMAMSGVQANGVRGVFPSVTYPSHTTILTGVMPAQHGIYYNAPFEPDGPTGRWYWEENLIKTETLWDAVHKAGLKSASVFWPVSAGAPVDYNIPEVWSIDKTVDRVSPIRKGAFPKGLFEEIEQNATGKLQEKDLNSDYMIADENGSRMAAYLIETYKPNLLTFHIFTVDHAAHVEGREGEHVRKAVATADRAVGNILEAIEKAGIRESTAVIVTGDHGFVDINQSFSPNIALARNGLIGIGKGEWKTKFHTSGAAAFLYLKDKKDIKTFNKVKKILSELPESQKKLFRVVERAELAKIGADPNAELALAPVPGVTMSAATDGEILKAAKGGTHGYFPDFKEIQTGFIGYGSGFKTKTTLSLMGLEDIAPIVCQLLGVSLNSAATSNPTVLRAVAK
ncbi:alkaline phosphatase family protein [Adhaeribacter rhizoryzae]|uniref:Sulfatase-like hydrolase/transferase n=1 Tax=Adhaeribacter rhizoryzae TaxID=2607907 RepID=A0A5M6D5T4_9BACT|nr:ectonucleotide pyrophosphatase/phosphodiesterase [Adhaeribacter rhizoryzae]KAA5541672.1 sulfatase-like hydrolase/transferase [Adhaeribacter rhizoryzae]